MNLPIGTSQLGQTLDLLQLRDYRQRLLVVNIHLRELVIDPKQSADQECGAGGGYSG
jgi:hypothetical protein